MFSEGKQPKPLARSGGKRRSLAEPSGADRERAQIQTQPADFQEPVFRGLSENLLHPVYQLDGLQASDLWLRNSTENPLDFCTHPQQHKSS